MSRRATPSRWRSFVDFTRAVTLMRLRNREALFWTFFFPIILMALLGIVFGRGYDIGMSIGVVERGESGPVGGVIVAAFRSIEGVEADVMPRGEAMQQLEDGDLSGVLVLPPGLTQDFAAGDEQTDLAFYYDQSNAITAGQVLTIASQVVEGVANRISGYQPKLALAPVGIQTAGFDYLDFLVPGIVALSLMQTGIFAIGFQLVFDKEKGILRRLRATPMPLGSYSASMIAVQLVIALIQTAIILLVGMLIFGVDVNGSLWNVAILSIIGGGCFVSLGFALASLSKDVNSANAVMQVVQMPMMFLSGIFFPMDNAPAWIQPVVKAMPLTYLAEAMRDVVVDGHSLWFVRWDIVILLGFTVVFMAVAIKLFRWE
jgi:ABC-2 type transport system permease protein